MMMEDEMDEGQCLPAAQQAGALESIPMADASIQALHKKLAAAGAAAAQPTSAQSFDDLLASGQTDYSGVEESEPELG